MPDALSVLVWTPSLRADAGFADEGGERQSTAGRARGGRSESENKVGEGEEVDADARPIFAREGAGG